MKGMLRRTSVGVLGAMGAATLLAAGPRAGDLPAGPTVFPAWVSADPEHALVTGVGIVAWALVTWTCLGFVLGAVAGVPGRAGRLARTVLRRTTPVAVRKLLEVALGISVAGGAMPAFAVAPGVSGASPGWSPLAGSAVVVSSPGGSGGAGSALAAAAVGPWPDLDRPVATPRPAGPVRIPAPVLAVPSTTGTSTADPPSTGPPTAAPPAAAPSADPSNPDPPPADASGSPRPSTTPVPTATAPVPDGSAPGAVPRTGAPPAADPAPRPAGEVVVQPGDTLWGIAARALGPGATPSRIALAWPRWYEANRAVIGPDPDLLLPGQRLRPPAVP